MHRFYIPPAKWNLDRLELDEAETHHALHVLRLKQGDRAAVFNGRGAEATVEITGATKSTLELRRLHHSRTPPLPCEIILGQAVPKGKNMELIIQKATELGASSVAPLLSDRTVIQYEPDEAAKKQEKWHTVVVEAAKQCGQNWIPSVERPVTMKQFFDARPKFDLMLIASLQSDAKHLKNVLSDFGEKHPARTLILVGPEGDFTPAEISLAKSHGCQPITLGPIVLRTETAAIYCLSVLSYELLSR